jgi:hypothetical protein
VTPRERNHLHQLHPAKLSVDVGTAVAAGALLWSRRPVAAAALGLGPSIAVSLAFLSGRLDGALEAIGKRPAARALAGQLSAGVDALRFAGLALSWAGCWLHRAWLIPSGALVVIGGWLLAWRRSQEVRPVSAPAAPRDTGAGTPG